MKIGQFQKIFDFTEQEIEPFVEDGVIEISVKLVDPEDEDEGSFINYINEINSDEDGS